MRYSHLWASTIISRRERANENKKVVKFRLDCVQQPQLVADFQPQKKVKIFRVVFTTFKFSIIRIKTKGRLKRHAHTMPCDENRHLMEHLQRDYQVENSEMQAIFITEINQLNLRFIAFFYFNICEGARARSRTRQCI